MVALTYLTKSNAPARNSCGQPQRPHVSSNSNQGAYLSFESSGIEKDSDKSSHDGVLKALDVAAI